MDKGIYCLIFHNPACMAGIGALGELPFRKGWHVYIGSALGAGGLKRLERHLALAEKKDKRPTWHVDYLLTNDIFALRYAVYAPTTLRLECILASALGGESVPAFGCSDCSCPSHLMYRETDPVQEVRGLFRSLQLTPVTKTLKNP